MKASSSKKPSRKKKERIDPDLYNEYLRALELKSLRLCRMEAQLLEEPPEQSSFAIGFKAKAEMKGVDYAPHAAFIARIMDGETECVRIEAEYCVRFAAPGPPPEGFDEAFFAMNLSRMTYPFFREVVATTTARMDLPMLVVPIHIFGPRPKASAGTEEKKSG